MAAQARGLRQLEQIARPELGAYALVYVAFDDEDRLWRPCALRFLRMLAAKYAGRPFQVVMHPTLVKKLRPARLATLFAGHFDRVVFVARGERAEPAAGATLYVRADVLPVANRTMLALMRHSVRDILITGDQSLTDVLGCCPSKNVFYQIMPWKEHLAQQLARLMPNPNLRSRRTACGSMGALAYSSAYARFVRAHAFHVRARAKLDAIVAQAHAAKTDADVRAFMRAVTSSRTLGGALRELARAAQKKGEQEGKLG